MHDERLRRWPLQRLRTEGLALIGMRAAPSGAYFGKTIVTLCLDQGGPLPFHKFRCCAHVVLAPKPEISLRN